MVDFIVNWLIIVFFLMFSEIFLIDYVCDVNNSNLRFV